MLRVMRHAGSVTIATRQADGTQLRRICGVEFAAVDWAGRRPTKNRAGSRVVVGVGQTQPGRRSRPEEKCADSRGTPRSEHDA